MIRRLHGTREAIRDYTMLNMTFFLEHAGELHVIVLIERKELQ
jgi:hypothetical protein